MEITFEPWGDVELPDGASVRRVREALAALVGAPELADAVLVVDGTALDDDHVAGSHPLVHGAVVTIRAARPDGADLVGPDPATLAARSPWHVAALTGPAAGAVTVPARDGAVRLGRGGGTRAGVLDLGDPAASREHAVVVADRRWRPGAAARGAARPGTAVLGTALPGTAWRVRDVGSANGTTTSGRTLDRHRRVGPRGRRLRPGQEVRVGDSTVVVRLRADRVREEGPRTGAPPRDVPPPRASAATWLAPAAASVAFAAATGNPLLLVLGLAGPLAAVVPALARRRHRSRSASGVPRRAAPAAAGGPGGTTPAEVARAVPDAARLTVEVAGASPDDAPRTPDEPTAWWSWAQDGLAVVGPGRHAVARVLVADRAAWPGSVTVLGGRPDAWSWLRWPAGASGGRLRARWDGSWAAPGEGELLVVADGAVPPDVHAWWAARSGRVRDGALVLVSTRAEVPAWCRRVVTADPAGRARLDGPDGTCDVRLPVASSAWATAHARRLAARWAATQAASSTTGGAVPDAVALADLCGVPDPARVAATWRERPRRRRLLDLAAPLGVAAGRPLVVDLLADGPHALVAGTTGSGKSELLRAWVLALALRHPPHELAVVLVDFKAGAGFTACGGLPHVVGLVTDLDAATAGRALAGLRAELRRRKELLAAAGVSDLEDLRARADAPPRLLVVVDEFRALADELPDFVPGLVDLAAQGRSLGLHLVLATQRPAGAVTAQMRANLALRVCLRVTDAADSQDVVDVPGAAEIPPGAPGRALVRRGGAPVLVQTAWAAGRPGAWAPPPAPGDPVRARWVRPAPERAAPAPAPAHDGVGTAAFVAACARAADLLGERRPAAVWLPPLPGSVTDDELAASPGAAGTDLHRDPATAGAGLVLGVTDLPDVPARGLLTWRGPTLAVVGRPGSGRTTALRVAIRAALARGRHVHVVGAADLVTRDAADHPALGTHVDVDDPRRLARLLTLLLDGEPSARTAPVLVALDDVGGVQRALERLPRAAGADLVDRLLADGPRTGLHVALTGTPAELSRLLARCGERLVLATDRHDDVLAGAPPGAAARTTPGRALLVDGARTVVCQLARPGGSPPAPTPPRDGPPPRLRRIPTTVAALPRRAHRDDDGRRVAIGLGGDDAGPVHLDVVRGALVVGPPGSGRSTALATLAAQLAAHGADVIAVAAHGPLVDVAERLAPAVRLVAPEAAAEALAAVGTGAEASPRTGGRAPVVVLVDDADTAPCDDALVALTAPRAPGALGAPGVVVVAAARTDRAAAAYRGVLATLRGAVPTLVLAPTTPGSAEVAGADLALASDPGRAPGRGVLVDRGRPVPVQVARPGGGGPSGGGPDDDGSGDDGSGDDARGGGLSAPGARP